MHTKETKKKISEAHMGEKNPFYGRKHSEETKRKWSESRKGEKHPFYGRKHSEKSKIKMSEAKKGSKSSRWNGGKYIDSDGYVFIYKPEHPFANRGKYVKRANLVLEKHLGGYLKPGELAHHKNAIRHDDRIENLQLAYSNSYHIKLHRPKEGVFFKSVVN